MQRVKKEAPRLGRSFSPAPEAPPHVVAGSAMVVAGGLVAAANSAVPFAHGSWLAAYLVLVGGVAQIALGAGLGAPSRPTSRAASQCALWNAGSLLVPAGVMLAAPAVVVAGSVPLLVALARFATSSRAAKIRRRGLRAGYLAMVVGLAASVVVGCLLAFGAPDAHAGMLLPERGGSPNADRIASLYAVVLVVALIVFVGVVVALVFALVRYRERRGSVASQIRGHTRLEIAWTVAASLLIVALAVFSFTRFPGIDDPDASVVSPAVAASVGASDGGRGALRIEVVGRQYIWMYRYPGGVYSYKELVAPVGVTVELDIVSMDVAHSWWIPKLGGKFDALPGYVNHTWFQIERPGVYRGQCAELCGRNHADMIAQVRGVTPATYVAWLRRQKRSLAAADDALAHPTSRALSTQPEELP